MRGWFWALLIMAGLAFLAGCLLVGGQQDDPRRWAEADAIRAQAEEQQRWAQASAPVRLALLALGGGGVLTLLLFAGYRFVERRTRVIYPNRDGLLPAVVLKPGEVLVDAGALSGPLVVGAAGPEYRLPASAIPQLQSGANQGAATSRTMRAWATHEPAARETTPAPHFVTPQPVLPPVEVLPADETHVLRLLEEGEDKDLETYGTHSGFPGAPPSSGR